ncbi:MAG: Hsp20/alpha crystallin family protein [Proteobacteria bacterium]|nr:Hsp20/alpha crystallin family protein [Pseudomonadota bacterium]MBU4470708.1 Hsp20/alpha crystallin family protein [Pseudomonadota bacterium]MCG2751196.1 Hsp20/alpha crystallin family protein [Desulfobacteraceae bacterium]
MDFIKIRFTNHFDPAGSSASRNTEDLFRLINPLFTLSERTLKPQIDVYESQKEILILAEIAGVDKEDLEVEICRNTLRIAGRRKQMRPGEKGTYRLVEIQYGPFERCLILPSLVDTENVSASYVNGLLHIQLSKISDRTKTNQIQF